MPRIFFALTLPGEIKAKLHRLQLSFAENTLDVKWVEQENIHLTLQFLGEVPAGRIQTVISGAARAAEQFKPFLLEIKGTGAFPDPRRPRVLWAGVGSGAREAGSLAAILAECIGIKHDKPFSPHITVGRVREGRHVHLDWTLASLRNFNAGVIAINSFSCLESTLTPRGPVYRERSRFILQEKK